ncbi:MAG TPA: hypothetical protein VEB22_03575 [Phycisphaerales bacterium]|nr:hypothetical protein [Phycisphaerales bacterium]
MEYRTRFVALAVPVLLTGVAEAQSLSITPLGRIPGWDYARVVSISGDGQYAVGITYNPSTLPRAARWSTDGAAPTLMLPHPIGTIETAPTCSGDGSVVFGSWNSSSRGFRWTESGGSSDIQAPTGRLFRGVHSVSDDGTRGVGHASGTSPGGPNPPLPPAPCLWTLQSGVQLIDIPAGHADAQLVRISPDGGTAVGYLTPTSTGLRVPATWSESGGWRMLPMIPGADFAGGTLVSSGGTVAVMSGMSQGFFVAARWTEEGGTVPITSPAVTGDIHFNGMSADGSVLVGQGQLAQGGGAVLWTPDTGLVLLDDYLSSLGLDLTGWSLLGAMDVSNDGRTIVGTGVQFFPDGTFRSAEWVVTVPTPPAALIAGCALICGAARRKRFNNA